MAWPEDWQWVDESDPTIPPTIPDSAHGKWLCYVIRTCTMPDGDTFTSIVLSYIYGTASVS